MKFLCLCPTYGHPRLVENAIACFVAQDYPADQRRLLVFDDAGQLPACGGDGWRVVVTADRQPSLPAKYHAMLAYREQIGTRWIATTETWLADAYVVWDDDDIYLPWHLSAHAAALSARRWSHPTQVWSLYGGLLRREGAAGRFHGALALRRELCERLGGWLGVMPLGHERRADFDQRMIAACQAAAGLPGRPDQDRSPSYVYRWGSTLAPHCSALMSSPDNEDWYERYAATQLDPVTSIHPIFDDETTQFMNSIQPTQRA